MKHHTILAVTIGACVVMPLTSHLSTVARAQPAELRLEADAQIDAQIEKHRKGDVTIQVVDVSGSPVPDASVRVEQTNHAFLFGCNIFWWGPSNDRYRAIGGDNAKQQAAYKRQFAELFNYATLPFYWMYYEKEKDKPRHAYMATLVKWCHENNIKVKGHPLAWNWHDPKWLADIDSDEIYRRQLARIDDIVSRFKGKIDCWDVVNEVSHFDRDGFVHGISPKYSDMWQRVGRMELTVECFKHAREANPNAILLINDYKRDPDYERVIEQLVDEDGKRLYDAIGIQNHMGYQSWSYEGVRKTCDRFSRFGVPIHFTEGSISSAKLLSKQDQESIQKNFIKKIRSTSTPEGEARQAEEVIKHYRAVFACPEVEALTWWDMCDYSAGAKPTGFLRKDMTPKPSYHALKKLIKDAWWTRANLTTDRQGAARLNGFYGDYRVVISRPGRQDATYHHRLAKDHENRWAIVLEE